MSHTRISDESIAGFIREAKSELRRQSDSVKSFTVVRDAIRKEVDQVHRADQKGESLVPEVDYASIANEKVSRAMQDEIRRRGCVIVRNVFARQQAEDWNAEIGEYLDRNNYLEQAREKAGLDNYFGDLADAKPQIYGIYWSKPQVMARQADTMAATKRFLNRLWSVSGPTGDEFDPDHDYAYADRTRRRTPGDTTLGLSPHMDSGSYERWVDPAFQKIYAKIFRGDLDGYDPWNAAYRTQTREYASPAVCSMFRTFQGWTALTRQGPGDGTLQLVPIAKAIGYVLLRGLQDDMPDNDIALARPGRALGIDSEWHPDLMPALVSIPEVQPGDTVWWHPDVVHAVGNEHSGDEYANVIYIGASPKCEKNEMYARRQASRFLAGESAPDFAPENYEVEFESRAMLADLTETGRAQMAIDT